MINVSNEFLEMMKEKTDFCENAEVTFADGTVIELQKSDFTISNNYVVDGAGSSTFPLGEAIERNIQIELMNDEGQFSEYVFTDAKIRLFLTFELTDSVEKIEMGTFTVLSPETYGDTVIVSAVDDMYKADVSYTTDLSFPATIGSMVRDSCEKVGLLLGTATFHNDDFVVAQIPEGITHRQLYGYAAMLAGGNARINRQGKLEIIPYDFSYTNSYVLDKWKNLKTDTENITITGIKAVFQDGETEKSVIEGTEEYAIKVQNPLITGQEQTAVSLIGEKLIGAVFRQFEGDHTGCPLVEFMDPVQIIDRKGNSCRSVVTDINFVFFGCTTLKNSSEQTLRRKSSYSSAAAEAYQKAKKLIKSEQTARETAIKNLEKTLTESGGLYATEEKQDDGSVIFYFHNKPTLKESKNVIKVTADAVGLSTDGGKTYPAGFTIDGDMIAKILQAEGVNATWINTGALVVKDRDGAIIFSADMDTGKVIISGESVKIGKNILSKELEDLRNEIKNNVALTLVLDNEYQGISTDYQGNYVAFPEVQTTATVLYGQTDISTQCSYSITTSVGITGSWNEETRTYIVTDLLSDDGWIDIKATYLSIYSVTKRFAVSKVKGGIPGADGQKGDVGEPGRVFILETSVPVVKIGTDEKPSPSYLQFGAYCRDGASTSRVSYAGRFKVEETVDGSNWTTVYRSISNESTLIHSLYSFIVDGFGNVVVNSAGNGIGIKRDISAVRCSIYAADGFTALLDRQMITVVKDIDALTHEDVFNLLTNNGQIQGVYKEGDQIYINATYIRSGTFVAGGAGNQYGRYEIRDANNNVIGYWDKDGFVATKGIFSGIVSAGQVIGSYINGSTIFAGSFSTTKQNSEDYFGNIRIEGNSVIFGNGQKLTSTDLGLYVEWIIEGEDGEDSRTDFSPLEYLENVELALTGCGTIKTNGELWSIITNEAEEYGGYWKYTSTREPIFNGFNFYKDVIAKNLYARGTKSRIVDTEHYGTRAMYCYETPTPMFGDIGTAKLNGEGVCYVSIDDLFSETVDCNIEYCVFLQKEGEGNLWIETKEYNYFVVKGTPNLNFAWEVKAIQNGFEYLRLDDLALRQDIKESNELEEIADAELLAYEKEVEELK